MPRQVTLYRFGRLSVTFGVSSQRDWIAYTECRIRYTGRWNASRKEIGDTADKANNTNEDSLLSAIT